MHSLSFTKFFNSLKAVGASIMSFFLNRLSFDGNDGINPPVDVCAPTGTLPAPASSCDRKGSRSSKFLSFDHSLNEQFKDNQTEVTAAATPLKSTLDTNPESLSAPIVCEKFFRDSSISPRPESEGSGNKNIIDDLMESDNTLSKITILSGCDDEIDPNSQEFLCDPVCPKDVDQAWMEKPKPSEDIITSHKAETGSSRSLHRVASVDSMIDPDLFCRHSKLSPVLVKNSPSMPLAGSGSIFSATQVLKGYGDPFLASEEYDDGFNTSDFPDLTFENEEFNSLSSISHYDSPGSPPSPLQVFSSGVLPEAHHPQYSVC